MGEQRDVFPQCPACVHRFAGKVDVKQKKVGR